MEDKYKFKIDTSNNGKLNIPLKEGNALFVLGANGVGKSTLMHSLFNQNADHAKRIIAHRQTWFSSNAMDMTAAQKKQHDEWIKGSDRNYNARWMDNYSQQRSSISIFNLINSENVRARAIANAFDSNLIENAQNLSRVQSPLQAINELFAVSNIPIVISLGKDDQLFATKNGSSPYSVAELSDGERNVLLICADVLTTPPNYLIILDEPERHLHRSIISPLLSSLFQKRSDCVFVISTHDVFLPVDHSQAGVLLLRGCQWNESTIIDWDADLIENVNNIPDSIKYDILGSKRSILFVEGNDRSLDKQIYQLIFPSISVISQGNCVRVEKAVEGIRGTKELHWLNALGLIDADDRTPEQIQTLHERGVAALECYSVESLYYNLEIVRRVAKRYAEIGGLSESELFEKAVSEGIRLIQPHKDKLCARLCEKRVRNQIMALLPKHQDIIGRGDFEVKFKLGDFLQTEEAVFDQMVTENNLNGLIQRYPVRETPVLSSIAGAIGLTREKYERSVRKLIIDDKETQEFFKSLLSPLTSLIEH